MIRRACSRARRAILSCGHQSTPLSCCVMSRNKDAGYDCVKMTELIPDKPVSSRGAKTPTILPGSEMLFSLFKCVPGRGAEMQSPLRFPEPVDPICLKM